MADEPRRSGRATKGQHTKIQEGSAEPSPKPTKGKGKKNKKAQQEQEEEEDEGDETVRCICGIGEDEDDEGRAFICCDNCNVWQHNDCMGLPLKYEPETYYCEQCKPEAHPAITEALQKGESPADIATRNRQEAHSKKKGGRKSKGGRASEVKAEASPAAPPSPEQNKRKHASETPTAQPSKLRKGSTQANDDVSGPAKGGRKQATDALKPAETISALKNQGRQNTAGALKKKFAQVIKEQSTKGEYSIPDGDTADSLGEQQALAVEHAMYANYCTPGQDPTSGYKDQFRNITANVGPNPKLILDLIDGTLTADALSVMTSGDMATDEQKKRDKEIKDENERLAMLKEDGMGKRRIRRTHKGDEYVDEDDMEINMNTAGPARGQLDGADAQAASPGAEGPRPPRISTDRSAFGGQEMSPGLDHRRSSSNFNIQNVWSSVQSPAGEQRPPPYSHAQSYQQQAPQGSHQNDADVDRLLGDDEGPESAPYSPTDAGTDPNVVWRGRVDMPSAPQSIACFDARAYHIAGSNLGGREKMAAIFPQEIALGGRIASNTADDYLCSLSAASRTDVVCLDLVPSANDAKGQAEFTKLFDYLLTRQRFGVVKEPHNTPVRDAYIIPLEAGTAPKPELLNRLVQNIVEDDRSRRMLIVVFVLRYRSPPQSAQATPTAMSAPTSAMSPTVGGSGPGPAQTMPVHPSPSAAPNGHSQGPYQPSVSQLPENPYAPPQAPQTYNSQQPSYPPTGPPPTNAPTLQPPLSGPAPDAHAMARDILGPYYEAPTAKSLLGAMGGDANALKQLRRVFDDHAKTRDDLQAFQKVIASQSSATTS